MAPVYQLQIVDMQGHVVTFHGKGPVERQLVEDLATELEARVPRLVDAVLERGGWWVRRTRLEAAVREALMTAAPQAAREALDAVLWAAKVEASEKHLG